MKNVLTRSLTGIVYIALIVGAILGGTVYTTLLAMLLAALAVDEFNRISDRHRLPGLLRVYDIILSMLPLVGIWLINQRMIMSAGIFCFLAYFMFLFVRFIVQLYIKVQDPLAQMAHSCMAQLYIVLPLACLLVIDQISPAIALLMFIMIWLNDTGAFCVGSLIGRHRLFERISPKKSWEGFFGGLLFAGAAGCVAFLWMGERTFDGFNVYTLTGLGLAVAVFSTWGDLIESLIKRTLGIKDSGNLLPGHGGILDRIDSLLLVAPFTLYYIFIIQTLF